MGSVWYRSLSELVLDIPPPQIHVPDCAPITDPHCGADQGQIYVMVVFRGGDRCLGSKCQIT